MVFQQWTTPKKLGPSLAFSKSVASCSCIFPPVAFSNEVQTIPLQVFVFDIVSQTESQMGRVLKANHTSSCRLPLPLLAGPSTGTLKFARSITTTKNGHPPNPQPRARRVDQVDLVDQWDSTEVRTFGAEKLLAAASPPPTPTTRSILLSFVWR